MNTVAAQWTPAYSAASQWALPGHKPGARDMIATATIGENQDAPFYARVFTKLNVLVTAAAVYDVLIRVYDANGTEVYGSEETPEDVIAAIDTSEPWSVDSVGFNLSLEIPGRGVFIAGGGQYRVEVTLEMNDEDAIPLYGTLNVRPALTYKQTVTQ